jgi:hypothetical protein
MASAGISAVLEVQIESGCVQTKDFCRDRGADQGDSKG